MAHRLLALNDTPSHSGVVSTQMPASVPCPNCKNDIPQPAVHCPHCGQPSGIYWNVWEADEPAERAALEARYVRAMGDATSRGANVQVQGFEDAIVDSKAVLARSESEVLRLATSTKQLYTTYYKQLEAGLKLPDGGEWDRVREITDTILFPMYKGEIRFAALSLNDIGLSSYGSCSISLRTDLISYRASVLEENSVLFVERHDIKASRPPNIPEGFRASWDNRAKLCVSKLAAKIDSSTLANQYSGILLKQGATSNDDEFIEVHIWGSISALTMEKVTVTVTNKRQRATIVKALRSKLAVHGVTIV